MKLIACHIENFGCLSNFDADFTEGLNVFHEENGWGKSTLAAFLKVMFYGFDPKKERNALDKERKLYEPWQGGTYGGQIDFVAKGKSYRVLRTFGATEKADTFSLYQLDTMTESTDYSSRLGEELFDIDAISFKRSSFIAQNDVLAETSDQIQAKLGNLVENTNDINNYETAMEELKVAMNRLTPDRVTGSLKKRKSQITALMQELKIYDAAEEGFLKESKILKEKEEEKRSLEKERLRLSNELLRASEAGKSKVVLDNFKTYMTSWQEKVAVFDQKRSMFSGEIPKKEEIDSLLQEYRSLEQTKAMAKGQKLSEEEIAYLEANEKFLEVDEEAITEMLETATKLQYISQELGEMRKAYAVQRELLRTENLGEMFPELEKRGSQLCFAVGIVIAGIIEVIHYFHFSFQEPKLHIAALCCLVGGLLLLLIVRAFEKRKFAKRLKKAEDVQDKFFSPLEELKESLLQLEEQVQNKDRLLRNFISAYEIEVVDNQYIPALYQIETKHVEVLKLKERRELQTNTVEDFQDKIRSFKEKVAAFGVPTGARIFDALMLMKEQVQEYEVAEAAVVEAMSLLEQYRNANPNLNELSENNINLPYTIEQYNEKINVIDASIEAIRKEIHSYRHNLEYLEEQMDLRDEKRQELEEARQLQLMENEQYEVYRLTSQYLKEAKARFNAKYMEPISRGFEKYFEILTVNQKSDWMVDANLDWKYREQGVFREAKWLSEGWKDTVGLCMRLALVDAMYPGEKPFLVLDDPFVNLDEEKLEAAQALLQQIVEDYQVVYFTCHSSRM